MPSLGSSFGRGAATMSLWELANSDCIVVMGSNMAENHPVGFRFVVQAKDRGATIIHVDPRFTRTSALADIYAPIRSGSDIAFLNGIIRYILVNNAWFRDFVLPYTNIATIIDPRFADTSEAEGLFSGWDEETKSYKQDSWQYKGELMPSPLAEHHVPTDMPFVTHAKRMSKQPHPEDRTLQHPNCVYQIMLRHFDRYTPEMVEAATGCPQATFLRVCESLVRNSGRERTGAFCYAVGWTHHSVGVQIIRAASIIQGLLGNVGRRGAGILALRGHCSIQGSTDIPTLYDMLPTYLPQPSVDQPHRTLKDFLAVETVPTGWWHNFPKYMVSLLRAWYGDAATKSNEWGYGYLPKLTGDHSQQTTTLMMADGVVKGLFVLGQNPVVGAVNTTVVQRGMAKLDWMVVRDFAMTETAEFWKAGTLVRSGEMTPSDIGTEVFYLPSAMAAEKDGTLTNTNRLVQWHDKVCEAPGDSRSDLWFMYHLGRRLKEMAAKRNDERDAALRALTWDYPVRGDEAEPDPEAVLREINGYTWPQRIQIGSYQELKDDGSTACGGWLYSGIFPSADHNQSRARIPDAPDGPQTHLGWAFAWPSNRRELYNRASADPDGKPWSERKRLVWWDEAEGKWKGDDVPDFVETKRPDFRPDWSKSPSGMDAISGTEPFIMIPDGKLSLFVPSGLPDGPLPAHYEPVESPVRNPFYAQQDNPGLKRWPHPGNEYHEVGDPRFPHILTTFRLTELHCGGIATRAMPHTAELQPELFVEIPRELAETLDVSTRDWVVLSTLRGEIEARAMVTDRLRPFAVNGHRVFQIGIPWVFGWEGYARGDSANVLLSMSGDPSTSMHTTKAATCNLRKGRTAPAASA
ncbi:MAG: molybdopterin-dependent oxidoreductase [Acetobacteraceae bacterium]|nr:molybdopterin-dependent oxidoreductase [Acetobacteraceae bacterium]